MVFTLSNPVDLESWSRRLIFVFQNAPLPNKNYESTSDKNFWNFSENFSMMFLSKFTILWNGSKKWYSRSIKILLSEKFKGEWSIQFTWLRLVSLSLKICISNYPTISKNCRIWYNLKVWTLDIPVHSG